MNSASLTSEVSPAFSARPCSCDTRIPAAVRYAPAVTNLHNNGMAEIKVRQLPDWVIEAHKQQAQRSGTSLEQHIRMILTESAQVQKNFLLKTARACREKLAQELGGPLQDRTADLVRQMRDERG